LRIREALKLLRQHDGTPKSPEPKDDGTPKPPKPKAKLTIAAWQAMDPVEQTKLLDDIGRERLCAAMSPVLRAEIAKHVLDQHGLLVGKRKAAARNKQLDDALAARCTDNVTYLPPRHH
jgi:hypothetical protein